MISSKKYVDETLKKNKLVANKALGQNFLVEEDIAKYIVENADIDKETFVIEIGPGLGALSEFIIQKCGFLRAYEIDKNMVNILLNTFINESNIEIINIDFVKVNLEEAIKEIKIKGYKKITIISNLPYYITNKLLNKILVNNLEIDSIVTMMQKEVGKKIINPDKKEFNQLNVILSYQYDVSVVKYVGKNSYLPRPEIDSIVLKFKKTSPKYDVSFDKVIKVTSYLYEARRKTIYNNLKPLFNDNGKLIDALKKCNLDINMHVEQLSVNDIIQICKYI